MSRSKVSRHKRHSMVSGRAGDRAPLLAATRYPACRVRKCKLRAGHEEHPLPKVETKPRRVRVFPPVRKGAA